MRDRLHAEMMCLIGEPVTQISLIARMITDAGKGNYALHPDHPVNPFHPEEWFLGAADSLVIGKIRGT